MVDRTLQILIVDDEPAHAEAVQRALQSIPGTHVAFASTLAACREAIAAQPPDLALVDLNLPDGRAVELLTSPPEEGAFPVVLMTSHGNEQIAVEAMKAGAIDYVVKSAEAFGALPRTVEHALREWKLRKERKRALEALHESEERHRTLFQKSHDALMTLAPPSWQYSSGNAAAVALFGALDAADFLSRTPWQFSPDRQPDGQGSKEKYIELLKQAMREGSLYFEWTHQRVAGEHFPATVLLTRLELNGLALLQATVRDESEKRRLQASVAQADRLASMGMLAAGVAHEINNPLSYVLANVDSLVQDLPRFATATERCCAALRDRFGDGALAQIAGEDAVLLQAAMLADAIDRAREALEGTQRIKTIVRSLGTFSRVERTERAPVDPIVALEAAINMAHIELRHRARLVKDLAPVPAVWATEGKLAQVFLNLLVNAIHAIDEGNVRNNQITVRSWAEAGAACVEISDTGRGIPTEDLERIFEPFFTTKSAGLGSGLGLSICRNIMAELDGSLAVQSEVGKGTRFVVRLPILEESLQQPRAAAGSDSPKLPWVRGRILVVDDETAIQKSLGRLLGSDHELVTAASGEQAQALLTHDSAFDLILCDLTMPQMSGIELHTWLSVQNPRLARQTVFITGGTSMAAASEYLASVRNIKIEKPFDSNRLKRLVAELVSATKSQQQS